MNSVTFDKDTEVSYISTILRWCFDNFGNCNTWYYNESFGKAVIHEYRFSFLNEEDYVEFILRWK